MVLCLSEGFDPIILPGGDSGQNPNQNPNQMSPKEKTGCAVLIAAAVLGIILGNKIIHTPWLMMLVFGAGFLFLGILALRSGTDSPKPDYRFGVLFSGIGAAGLADGLAMTAIRFGLMEQPGAAVTDKIKAGVFVVIGLAIIGYVLAAYLRKRRYCTERVEGLVVDMVPARRKHRSRQITVPVYEFFCGGTTHQLRDSIGSHWFKPHVGETRTIYVDPEHLDEMYEPKRYIALLIFPAIFGLLVTGLGVWLMMLPPVE